MNATNRTGRISLGGGNSKMSDNSSYLWYLQNIFVWMFPLLCLQGVIVNAASFVVIAFNRKSFPYVTRQYLAIITLSDFFILACKATTLYLAVMAHYVKSWSWYVTPTKWSFGWCVAYNFITCYAAPGASFFQLGLTFDRLVAVAAPLKAKVILSPKKSWILLAAISVMALFFPILNVSELQWSTKRSECVDRIPYFYENVYQQAELYFGKVFLCSALLLGTVAICLLLAWNNRAARRMQAETAVANLQQRASYRERRRSLVRISLMLIFFNVIILGTLLPWSIISNFEAFFLTKMSKIAYNNLLEHFDALTYLGNALTWPVYFLGRNFRQAFCYMFLPQCLQRAVKRFQAASSRSRPAQQQLRYRRSSGITADSSISLELRTELASQLAAGGEEFQTAPK